MSQPTTAPATPSALQHAAEQTALNVLIALSVSHLLNDTIQSLLPAIYPVLKDQFRLSFTQVGLITLTFQGTASLLQPLIGFYTDRNPRPFSLATGMGITLTGLVLLAGAGTYPLIIGAAALVGLGSAIFHPEASRVARMASGGRHGFAQSLFQVGGNLGSSLGPLLAALIIVPRGQHAILWFSVLALGGILLLSKVGGWYARNLTRQPARAGPAGAAHEHVTLSRGRVVFAIAILLVLIFSKYFYLVSLSNYYTFYLIDKFHVTVAASQYYLFAFLFAVAAGTIIGGPVGDRIGRKRVIWGSILGVAPFSLVLPHVGLAATVALTVVIGVILASAFSAILVYAQELLPGRVGLIAGLFFGFAFGMGGIGSAVLGRLADHTSIGFVFSVCAWLPLIGLVTGLLPDIEPRRKAAH
ncbi:MAG: MFS transporter [Opitutae bacterium]|nr:MFS transporter [Opitutae bacterium]